MRKRWDQGKDIEHGHLAAEADITCEPSSAISLQKWLSTPDIRSRLEM